MKRLLHPRYWGYHLVVAVALVAAGLLGLWQYHGWQERRDAEARDLTQVAPIPLADAIGPDDPFPGQYVGQPVEVHGRLRRQHLLGVGPSARGRGRLLGGRPRPGRRLRAARRPGLGGDAVVGAARTRAAGIRRPGRLAAALRERRAPPTTTRTTTLLPQLRVADLAQHFDQDLYGAYVVARDPVAGVVQADLDAAARRRPVHRPPQPAVRGGVVVLRRLRAVHLVALGPRDRRARDFRPDSRGHSVGSLDVNTPRKRSLLPLRSFRSRFREDPKR